MLFIKLPDIVIVEIEMQDSSSCYTNKIEDLIFDLIWNL